MNGVLLFETFELERKKLVNFMKVNKIIKSKSIENAFLSVKRENFVNEELKNQAYLDIALPLSSNQTISQPSTIAIMLELLKAKKGDKVLEVGVGSGYVLALLSKIIEKKGKVIGIDIVKELIEKARKNLVKERIKNFELLLGDGSEGLIKESPFDRILVSCACPSIPKPLIEQLAEGGRVIAPVGDKYLQEIKGFEKKKKELIKIKAFGNFVFVPLIGKYGFKT